MDENMQGCNSAISGDALKSAPSFQKQESGWLRLEALRLAINAQKFNATPADTCGVAQAYLDFLTGEASGS